MDEFADPAEFGRIGQAFLQEILDRLDVMVGRALDFLDPRRIGRRELGDQAPQALRRRVAQRRYLRDAGLGRERCQPADLDRKWIRAYSLNRDRRFSTLSA